MIPRRLSALSSTLAAAALCSGGKGLAPVLLFGTRHWSVTVAVEGMDVVTIESNCLSGLENVTDYRPEIIEAAEHLLAFIGTGDDPDFDFEDMPNADVEAPPRRTPNQEQG